jgi:hypothetical protein
LFDDLADVEALYMSEHYFTVTGITVVKTVTTRRIQCTSLSFHLPRLISPMVLQAAVLSC